MCFPLGKASLFPEPRVHSPSSTLSQNLWIHCVRGPRAKGHSALCDTPLGRPAEAGWVSRLRGFLRGRNCLGHRRGQRPVCGPSRPPPGLPWHGSRVRPWLLSREFRESRAGLATLSHPQAVLHPGRGSHPANLSAGLPREGSAQPCSVLPAPIFGNIGEQKP